MDSFIRQFTITHDMFNPFLQAMLASSNVEPEYGLEADGENLIDTTDVDVYQPIIKTQPFIIKFQCIDLIGQLGG